MSKAARGSPPKHLRHQMQLAAIDINLLIPLDALLHERSVTRASKRLGLSPSATSHALQRLRDLFHDELLVRTGRDMVCTPRADAMRPQVREMIEQIEGLFHREQSFDPRALSRRFYVATTDHLELLLLGRLGRVLAAEAPNVVVHDYPVNIGVLDDLRDGRLDLAFSAFQTPPEDFAGRVIFEGGFVTLMRKGHPKSQGPLTLERFLELEHIAVSPVGARTAQGGVDDALSRMGVERRIVMSLASFLPAPFLIAESDYVLTASKHLVRAIPPQLELHAAEPPLKIPHHRISLIWHRRMDTDPGHRWFRETVIELCRS